MYSLANDDSKNIILLINDYNDEFEVAMNKLSSILGRELEGYVLVDNTVLQNKQNKAIIGKSFKELRCDYSNPASITKVLKPIENRLLAVNASSERNQPYYKKVIPHIPYINTPTESSLDWATLKDKMRVMLNSYDANLSPKSLKINTLDNDAIAKILNTISFPIISKPVGLAASVLVKKSDDINELKTNLTYSLKNIDEAYKKAKGRGKPELLVEEYIEGQMYSIDAYVNESGRVWTLPPIKVTTAAAIGLEGYYSYRNDTLSELSEAECEASSAAARNAIYALGLKSSSAHIELFNSLGIWKIIELGPRAGGYRQDMYWYAYGIDHALNELLVKVGLEPTIIKDPIAYCAILNVYAESEGTIERIEGFEAAKNIESVKWLRKYAKPGDRSIFCGNGGNFIFDGVLVNNNYKVLNEDMAKVRSLLKITVRPSPTV